ncbi:MAG: hypothetical protein QXE04_00785 [Thermoplasmatales archaeon]
MKKYLMSLATLGLLLGLGAFAPASADILKAATDAVNNLVSGVQALLTAVASILIFFLT